MKKFGLFVFCLMSLFCLASLFGRSADRPTSGTLVRERSSRWTKVRNDYIKAHPTCEACGRKATQIHHVVPFHLHPEKELDSSNLIALCDRDHLLFGHLDNFQSFNPDVRKDAAAMLAKIKSRPRQTEE